MDNLSLLDLAPGGHLGRFIIWTKGAFEKLDSLFGTYDESAKFKSGFNLPRSMMTNADLARIMYVLLLLLLSFHNISNILKLCVFVFSNSDEIQSVLKPAEKTPVELPAKRNPLKNSAAKIALNPYHAQVREP